MGLVGPSKLRGRGCDLTHDVCGILLRQHTDWATRLPQQL